MKLFQSFFQIISVNLNIKCIKYIYLWVFYWLNWLLIMIMMICPTSPTAGLAGPPPAVRAGPHNRCSLLIKILKIPDKNNENARSEFFRKSIDIITLTSKSKVWNMTNKTSRQNGRFRNSHHYYSDYSSAHSSRNFPQT